MKKSFLVIFLLFTTLKFFGQVDLLEPVTWNFFINEKSNSEIELTFEASLDPDWKIFSQESDPDNGPFPTYFEFSEGVELLGATLEEGHLVTMKDPLFDNAITKYYSGKVVFKQIIKASSLHEIKVFISYMACNQEMCLPPGELEIVFNLKDNQIKNLLEENIVDDNQNFAAIPELPNLNINEPILNCGEDINTGKQDKGVSLSMLIYFLLGGILGGLLSIFTPCVFPMIPLTVSFFTKSNETKGGVFNAILYGVFILLIYASLSIPFHFGSDPEMLNQLSTNWILNVIFFLVFMFFAFSFFGYYDLKLPSKWASKSDTASSKTGLIGIFFMALTLAIVSFSCTGPILGSVLANSLTDGPWPITVAMVGFGFSLGFPFAIFAMFPRLMNKLPQSGGWLNSIKVILGFIEIALAFKFLSTADLVEDWGILKIEAFLISWILVGLGMTLYMLGKLKFPHDNPVKKISLGRGVLAAIFFSITIYLISGFRLDENTKSFTSLKLLSGLAPPSGYSWLYPTKCPNGLNCYHDFEEGVKIARAINKPILLDFTGKGCVNCRKMEEHVWSQKEVFDIINEEYVLISLYVDDREPLPVEEQGIINIDYSDGSSKIKRIKTIGNKWSTFQTLRFKSQSQPYYFLLSPEGELINNPVGYTPDKDKYRDWLKCGLEAYNKKKK